MNHPVTPPRKLNATLDFALRVIAALLVVLIFALAMHL
jgi:hypothetical protein